MIFQTQNQINCVLIFVFFGLIIGLISIIYFLLFLKNFQKITLKTIINTFFYAFFCIFYVFLINIFNFGKFSSTLFLSYFFSFVIFKRITCKSVGILEKKWYTIINNKLAFVKSKQKRNKLNKWQIKPKSNF